MVKQLIQAVEGTSVQHQRLLFAGRQLDDADTLSGCGIGPRAFLRLVMRVDAFVTLLLIWAFYLGSSVTFAGPLTEGGTQPGLSHSLQYAGDCAGCHGDFESTSDHEPYPTWSGSMMANAGRDPLFWAALDVANI